LTTVNPVNSVNHVQPKFGVQRFLSPTGHSFDYDYAQDYGIAFGEDEMAYGTWSRAAQAATGPDDAYTGFEVTVTK